MSAKAKKIWRWIWRVCYFLFYNSAIIVWFVYQFYGNGEAIVTIAGKQIKIAYALWDVLSFWEKGIMYLAILVGVALTIFTIKGIYDRAQKRKEIEYIEERKDARLKELKKQNSKLAEVSELLED